MLFELQERRMHDKQPHSQSSLAIPDVTSPVKLVGKISSRARFQGASSHSDLALVRGCISKVQESSRVQT